MAPPQDGRHSRQPRVVREAEDGALVDGVLHLHQGHLPGQALGPLHRRGHAPRPVAAAHQLLLQLGQVPLQAVLGGLDPHQAVGEAVGDVPTDEAGVARGGEQVGDHPAGLLVQGGLYEALLVHPHPEVQGVDGPGVEVVGLSRRHFKLDGAVAGVEVGDEAQQLRLAAAPEEEHIVDEPPEELGQDAALHLPGHQHERLQYLYFPEGEMYLHLSKLRF